MKDWEALTVRKLLLLEDDISLVDGLIWSLEKRDFFVREASGRRLPDACHFSDGIG